MINLQLVIIAGPNGAGNSTSATTLLPYGMPFINADDIAVGLDDRVNGKEMASGRLFLAEWDRLETEQTDFAVETTLASKTLAPRIRRMVESGYQFHLVFLWLPSVEIAIERVAERVRAGGHNIPVDTIRRRYGRGMTNFFEIYQPLADSWTVYTVQNSGLPFRIADGKSREMLTIRDKPQWRQFCDQDNRKS